MRHLALGCVFLSIAGIVPTPLAAQLMRWKATATGKNDRPVIVMVEFYRAGDHVEINIAQATDTIITRLKALGYVAEPVTPWPEPLPTGSYVVSIELWGAGGVRLSGGYHCQVEGYGPVLLSHEGGHATLGLEQFGDWISSELPKPTDLSGCPALARVD